MGRNFSTEGGIAIFLRKNLTYGSEINNLNSLHPSVKFCDLKMTNTNSFNFFLYVTEIYSFIPLSKQVGSKH